MTNLFSEIVEMSWKASIVILLVLLARLALKNAPQKFSFLLWGIVALRLVIPISIESPISVFNLTDFEPPTETVITETSNSVNENTEISKDTQIIIPDKKPDENIIGNVSIPENTVSRPVVNNPVIESPIINESVSQIVNEVPTITENNPAEESKFNLAQVLAVIWLCGMAGMLFYGTASFVKIKKLMESAVLERDNIYLSDKIDTPFSLGFIKPKIYLPFGLTAEEKECIIIHEKCHLKRLDHISKLFAFVLLSVHWFNPFCWIAFNRMAYDMETSCDEMVFSKGITAELKKTYSMTLVSIGTKKRFPAPSPINFDGITNIKKRITHILALKKPKIWVSVIAIVLCVITFAACITDGMNNDNSDESIHKTESSETSETSETPNDKTFEITISLKKDYKGDLGSIHFTENTPTNYDIVISTNQTLKDFRFVCIDESDHTEVIAELFSLEQLTADEPFMASTYLNDATSTRGIVFTDFNGKERYYAIRLSMNDGSVALSEFKPQNISTGFSITYKINSKLPFYNVLVVTDKENHSLVKELLLTESESKKIIQRINVDDKNNFAERLYTEDINGDGHVDIVLEHYLLTDVVYYQGFVWDVADEKYVYAPTYQQLPNPKLLENTSIILSSAKLYDKDYNESTDSAYFKNNSITYSMAKYDESIKDFVITNSLDFHFNDILMNKDILLSVTESKYENRNKITVNYYEIPVWDYFTVDKNDYILAPYFQTNSFWDLDSDKWSARIDHKSGIEVKFGYQPIYTEMDDPMANGGIYPHSAIYHTKEELITGITSAEDAGYHLYHTHVTKGDLPSFDSWIEKYTDEWFESNNLIIVRAHVDADAIPKVASVVLTNKTVCINLENYQSKSDNRQFYHLFIEIPENIEFSDTFVNTDE